METNANNSSIYRRTIKTHVLVLIALMLFFAALFGLHLDYDRKCKQYVQLTTLTYLFDRVEEPLKIDLQNNSRRFLLDYYSEVITRINALAKLENDKWNWVSYDIDSKMIQVLEDNYLSFEHYSVDDLRYLWNQDRITLEMPVVDYESLKLMIAKITTTFESRFSPRHSYDVRFDIEAFEPSTLSSVFLITASYGSQHYSEAVAIPIRMHRFTIDELNNLRMHIDGLYNSIFIVDDIAKSFDHNFPSLKSLPDSYQGVPPKIAHDLAEKELYKVFIKWSPPAEVTVLIMSLLCTATYLLLRIPLVEISTIKISPSCFLKAFLIGILPFGITAAVSLYAYMTLRTYVSYGEWFFIVIATMIGLQGVIFAQRFGVYMCSKTVTEASAEPA
ncbi:membrane hypothetical protein [Vibrio nigripulchritudo FTn2]|uniref:hypothetical protein n=1 Tax=Vibrio nigripulchritudo TaxID=28173 RepID=UPI0003B1FD8C|nr:hypothetical protein [Vibrio nigripulchritudo]CCN40055.1 membrane hypothetical protein [Vibrio nigripulchritudo FTn2]